MNSNVDFMLFFVQVDCETYKIYCNLAWSVLAAVPNGRSALSHVSLNLTLILRVGVCFFLVT